MSSNRNGDNTESLTKLPLKWLPLERKEFNLIFLSNYLSIFIVLSYLSIPAKQHIYLGHPNQIMFL